MTQHFQYRSRFPFRAQHRTMEDVAKTEALSEKQRKGELARGEARRLERLLSRADINNPPPENNPIEPEAA